MAQVNRVVGREFESEEKQTPFYYSTLTAKLLLTPKDLQPCSLAAECKKKLDSYKLEIKFKRGEQIRKAKADKLSTQSCPHQN